MLSFKFILNLWFFLLFYSHLLLFHLYILSHFLLLNHFLLFRTFLLYYLLWFWLIIYLVLLSLPRFLLTHINLLGRFCFFYLCFTFLNFAWAVIYLWGNFKLFMLFLLFTLIYSTNEFFWWQFWTIFKFRFDCIIPFLIRVHFFLNPIEDNSSGRWSEGIIFGNGS